MNILLCFNDRFVPLVRVLIISLMCHHERLHFYIGYIHLSEENQRSLKELVEGKCPQGAWPWDDGEFRKKSVERTIEFIPFNPPPMLKPSGHYPVEIWTRCFIWEKIPVDRLLYLDADVIVHGNIEQFYYDDLGNNLLKACPDYVCYGSEYRNIRWGTKMLTDMHNNYGYKNIFGHYCNSGVVLFNLELMRAEGLSAQTLLDAYNNLPVPLILPDQHFINLYFDERIKLANPYRYNCTIPPLTYMKAEHFADFASIDMSETPYSNADKTGLPEGEKIQARDTKTTSAKSRGVTFDPQNILIYHYSAKAKPNNKSYRHLYADIFWRYQFMDPQAPASLHITRLIQTCWGFIRRNIPERPLDVFKKGKNSK